MISFYSENNDVKKAYLQNPYPKYAHKPYSY